MLKKKKNKTILRARQQYANNEKKNRFGFQHNHAIKMSKSCGIRVYHSGPQTHKKLILPDYIIIIILQ